MLYKVMLAVLIFSSATCVRGEKCLCFNYLAQSLGVTVGFVGLWFAFSMVAAAGAATTGGAIMWANKWGGLAGFLTLFLTAAGVLFTVCTPVGWVANLASGAFLGACGDVGMLAVFESAGNRADADFDWWNSFAKSLLIAFVMCCVIMGLEQGSGGWCQCACS